MHSDLRHLDQLSNLAQPVHEQLAMLQVDLVKLSLVCFRDLV